MGLSGKGTRIAWKDRGVRIWPLPPGKDSRAILSAGRGIPARTPLSPHAGVGYWASSGGIGIGGLTRLTPRASFDLRAYHWEV